MIDVDGVFLGRRSKCEKSTVITRSVQQTVRPPVTVGFLDFVGANSDAESGVGHEDGTF